MLVAAVLNITSVLLYLVLGVANIMQGLNAIIYVLAMTYLIQLYKHVAS